jgi:hypothetical protein
MLIFSTKFKMKLLFDMPCDSSYMEANGLEIRLSQVACLLDELDGKEIDQHHWRGYHPLVYCRLRLDGDKMVAALCKRLQSVDVKDYSLEMQIWWRDHQAADKARVEAELAAATDAKAKEAAIAKLTPHERKLLGIR